MQLLSLLELNELQSKCNTRGKECNILNALNKKNPLSCQWILQITTILEIRSSGWTKVIFHSKNINSKWILLLFCCVVNEKRSLK